MAVRDREMKLLMRYLAGELDAPTLRQLEERLEEDAQLRSALQDLQSTWSALAPPDGEPKVPHQTSAILSKIRQQRDLDQAEPGWLTAPVWIKTGSLASLVVGVAMGLLLTFEPGAASGFGRADLGHTYSDGFELGGEHDLFLAAEPTSADLYWRALEASSGGLVDEQENGS